MAKRSKWRARRLKRAEVEHFFDILAAEIEPTSELDWETPLDLLVAVVLSAQATDKSVNAITADLFRECRAVEDYLALGQEALQERIRTIGLFRNKAKSIVGICECLRDEHGGEVPTDREALEALPGVGRKSANVVLNVAFGQPVIAVDTHVLRVSNRTGLVSAKTPLAVEKALMKRVPEKHLLHAHHYLILHGRYTCKARKPECRGCPVVACCGFKDKELNGE